MHIICRCCVIVTIEFCKEVRWVHGESRYCEAMVWEKYKLPYSLIFIALEQGEYDYTPII